MGMGVAVAVLAAALAGFVLGLYVASREKLLASERCVTIRRIGVTHADKPQLNYTNNKRCTLRAHHRGPHRIVLNENQDNEREDWFEDAPVVPPAAAEQNHEQAPES